MSAHPAAVAASPNKNRLGAVLKLGLKRVAPNTSAPTDDDVVEDLEELVDYLMVASQELAAELAHAENERRAAEEQLAACERKRNELRARQTGLLEKLARAQQPLRAG